MVFCYRLREKLGFFCGGFGELMEVVMVVEIIKGA